MKKYYNLLSPLGGVDDSSGYPPIKNEMTPENLDLLKLYESSNTPMHWHLSYDNEVGTELEIKLNLYEADSFDFPSTEQYWQRAKLFRLMVKYVPSGQLIWIFEVFN